MADRRLRRHLSQDEMNRGIGMLHSGLSQRHVANILGVSQSVVSRMWNRFITTGNVRHLHAWGRERSTNEVQDLFLEVQARRHRFDNATTLRRDFQNATGVLISSVYMRKPAHFCNKRISCFQVLCASTISSIAPLDIMALSITIELSYLQ